ncbi:MAG: metallophosphoesterase [Clostridia bacterium]|nr:metallophosphoesterase [Clostridia bacterium]
MRRRDPDSTSIRDYAERRERRGRLICAAALLLAFTAVSVAVDAYRCANEFVVTEYVLPTDKVTEEVSFVMISDLHESLFGEDNERLTAAIRALGPDAILCVGDMITRTVGDDKLHIGLDLMAEMAKISPTYMSLGNHEDIYVRTHGDGILRELKKSGVRLLELEYEDAVFHGQKVRIGGTSDYCFNYGMSEEEYRRSEKYAFFLDMCDTDSYSILLSHRPTAYRLESEAEHYEDWDLDLVLAGHTHGGLWRIPFIGCLYLPQQGFFPKLDKGLKDMGRADMIIGAGLGSEDFLFRFNDPCEIVSIRLVPAE